MRAGAKLLAEAPAPTQCRWRGAWRPCASAADVDATSSARTRPVFTLLIIGLLHVTETSRFMRRRPDAADGYFRRARKRHRSASKHSADHAPRNEAPRASAIDQRLHDACRRDAVRQGGLEHEREDAREQRSRACTREERRCGGAIVHCSPPLPLRGGTP